VAQQRDRGEGFSDGADLEQDVLVHGRAYRQIGMSVGLDPERPFSILEGYRRVGHPPLLKRRPTKASSRPPHLFEHLFQSIMGSFAFRPWSPRANRFG